jgi:hypothetical protein
MPRTLIFALLCLVGLSAPSNARAALNFNFTIGAELAALQGTDLATYNNVVNGFIAAGQRYSAKFSDNVTVQVTINFESLGGSILGQAGSNPFVDSYVNVRAALIADQTTADDATATVSLENVVSLEFLTNDPDGNLIIDADASNNNTFLDVNRANARALGLLGNGDTGEDASISFSSDFTWDFDPTNGIAPGNFDFVGVATHEIGHALGFVSGVDIVDLTSGNGPFAPIDLNDFAVFSVLDLYRYSEDSVFFGTVFLGDPIRDLATGEPSTGVYFSLDGGLTPVSLAPYSIFSTGDFNGDGNQASHWKDNLGIGLMDPTLGSGELGVLSSLDLLAFDVIGWDRVVAEVPEPGTLTIFTLGILAAAGYCRRQRKVASV